MQHNATEKAAAKETEHKATEETDAREAADRVVAGRPATFKPPSKAMAVSVMAWEPTATKNYECEEGRERLPGQFPHHLFSDSAKSIRGAMGSSESSAAFEDSGKARQWREPLAANALEALSPERPKIGTSATALTSPDLE